MQRPKRSHIWQRHTSRCSTNTIPPRSKRPGTPAGKQAGVFHAEPDPTRPPFVISMPPPNVTGRGAHGPRLDVHADGHPDALSPHARRQRGWLPGQDHAAIATQKRSRARACQRRTDAQRLRTREVPRARVAVARAIRRHHLPAVPRAWVSGPTGSATGSRWTRAYPRGHQGLRRALSRGPDLSRHAAGQLVPAVRHRRSPTPKSSTRTIHGTLYHVRYRARGRQRRRRRRDHAPRDHLRRRRRRGASRR